MVVIPTCAYEVHVAAYQMSYYTCLWSSAVGYCGTVQDGSLPLLPSSEPFCKSDQSPYCRFMVVPYAKPYCAQLSKTRMCKCSTATTGANQQNMGVAGPRLQGLYGRPKRGVRPNEPLIAHSSAADERLRKAINHTCWHQPGTEIKCRLARSASSQGFS